VVPQLAESWQALDELTWEFKLRRGVEFHKGDRFSARDVKFTLERVQNFMPNSSGMLNMHDVFIEDGD
jgi:peptide/nickel transport system substrate-binding protein